MPNQAIAAQELPGAYPVLPVVADSQDLIFTAKAGADPVECVLVNKKTMVLAHNTDASVARTITFTSVADTFRRTGDIAAYSLAAGEHAMFGPFQTQGWNSGTEAAPKLFFDVSNAALEVAVIELD